MSLELNKIAAAILTGGVIAMGAGFVSKLLVHEEHLAESVYKPANLEAPAEQVAEAEPMLEPVLPLLASASVEAGESLAKKCTACHAFEEGGPNKVGPGLWNVVGRAMASHEGFSYSEALQNAPDAEWSYSALNAFLASPSDYAPGTKMSYAGLKKVEERAEMIAYLRSLSSNPAPLPSDDEINAVMSAAEGMAEAAGEAMESAGEAMESAAEAVEGAVEGAVSQMAEAAGGMAEGPASGVIAMLATADAGAGEKVARKCAACHSFDEGGPNKLGPALWDVVGRDIGSHEGYSYSSALAEMGGTWDYQSLAGFLTNPKDWAPGTKMSFAGVKSEKDLANLIAYMRSLSNDPEPLPDNAAVAPAKETGGPAEETGEMSWDKSADASFDRDRARASIQQAVERELALREMQRLADANLALYEAEIAMERHVLGAEPDRGEALAQACANCHSWDEKGADLIGPNLFGLFGRRIATREGIAYSDCLAKFSDPAKVWNSWSYYLFDAFLTRPDAVLLPCEGAHPAVEAREERLALAAYFRLQGDEPYHAD